MATQHSRAAARLMISPAVILLLGWMLIPLGMTLYFSFLRYNLITPTGNPFVGWENYYWFLTDPSFKAAMVNTLVLVGGVLLLGVMIDEVGRQVVSRIKTRQRRKKLAGSGGS